LAEVFAFFFFGPGWRAFFSSWSACRCSLSALVRFSAMWTPNLWALDGHAAESSLINSVLVETVSYTGDCQYHHGLNPVVMSSPPLSPSLHRLAHRHLGLEWNGQVQPGRLQSPCLVSYVAFSLQKDEIIGWKTPSGYPGKELSVGSGDVSG
jgi:hypothetical protein